jgi:selenocysteine-specific elongation factor
VVATARRCAWRDSREPALSEVEGRLSPHESGKMPHWLLTTMKSIIVGTAGHIDHGKTALVKALTGIDADRLEEEKRRGITIDLGFAHMDLPATGGAMKTGETLRIGFVDVPGHERFVRNMLAGVGGIDLVLLVIAADESIKPQTREHFDILQLLGVRRGITVLTKSDAVDAETLQVVRMEVREFLRGTFLDNPKADNPKPLGEPAPIVAVSSLTGAGLDELKQAMVAVAADVAPRDSGALARLPIDRVFTMKGFGTVVTGTLVAGTIRPEDELEVFPTGLKVRVRGVQVHGQAAEAAVAGQRTALNVAGASIEELARGMTLAPPGTLETTRAVDVKLRLLASAPRALKDRARVHFHSYTMETVGEVVLYERDKLDPVNPTLTAKNAVRMGHPQLHSAEVKIPTLSTSLRAGSAPKKAVRVGHPQLSVGGEGFARIKLPEATLLLPGDRFIIRQFSPVVTIGGGVVLNAATGRGLERGDFLETLAGGDAAAIVESRIKRHFHDGAWTAQLVAETGWTRKFIEAQLAPMVKDGRVARRGELVLHVLALDALKLQVVYAVEAFQKKNPLAGGISKEELKAQTDAGNDEVFELVSERLVAEKKIEIAGELVRLPGQGVVMKDEEAESKKKIEDAFAAAGLKVPALHEVISGLKIDKARAQKIVTLLLRDRVLVKISDELVFHRGALEQLRRELAGYKTKSSKIDVAKFKELTGVSRKYAIPLLEYLDRERVTRRVGDAREIL